MKLIDLFEQDTKINLTPKRVTRLNVSNSGVQIGAGVQSKVFDNPKSGTVIKKTLLSDSADGFLDYVRLIAKHSDNPFFPKIYNAKVYTVVHPVGADITYLVTNIEKLQELKMTGKLSDSINKVITELGLESVNLGEFQLNTPEIRKTISEQTKNPQLKKALKLMEPLFQKFGSDLHMDNWMVRLTSVGPQLVMSDPFIGF